MHIYPVKNFDESTYDTTAAFRELLESARSSYEIPNRAFESYRVKRGLREGNFFAIPLPKDLRREGNSMDLTQLLALLMFILGLLTLIVEVIRLTFEVTTFYQKQENKSKKD